MSIDKQKPGAGGPRSADKAKPSTGPIVTRNIYVRGGERLYTLTEAGRAAVQAWRDGAGSEQQS